jgi:F-box and WD-40 domain protein CDC4
MPNLGEPYRPRSSQRVSLSWEEDQASESHRRLMQVQFAEECIETKTVTTTTTTKRAYPPLFVRGPRDLNSLDSKEYPLASRPTPPSLRKLTFHLGDEDNEPSDTDDAMDLVRKTVPLSPKTIYQHNVLQVRSQSNDANAEPDEADTPTVKTFHQSHHPEPSLRRSQRSSATTASPSYSANPTRGPQKSTKHTHPSTSADRLRRAVAQGSAPRRDQDRTTRQASGDLATPDISELSELEPASLDRPSRLRLLSLDNLDSLTSQSTSVYDAVSPAGSESQTVFSNVATPPITDSDLPFADPDESFPNTVRLLQARSGITAQDASLPSPRLSPTLAAAQLQPTPLAHEDDSDEERLQVGYVKHRRTPLGDDVSMDGSFARNPSLADPRAMLEDFDSMPDEFKTWMMYQFLRRCPRKTLQLVADVVNPALQCDFIQRLPLELSYHVLSYLDHRDLCRAAQVSKHWRNIVDSNETGWKELFDRDGFVLQPGELQKAITQGWGWQDPVGAEGCEVDLSLQTRMISSESELLRSTIKQERSQPGPKTRATKRKRGLTAMNADRAKRRAGGHETRDDGASSLAAVHKSEGPNSAASAAALAVPDPQIGLPSLRKLHLFKSLYRRHYMIRLSWTSGKVKPSHVAFTAHPRHVITCLQFDEDKIITGSDDTLIHVYDTNTGKLRTKLEGHEGGVWALQYEGNTLVSGSTDRSVRVWDIEKGICTQTFFGHTSTVRCLQIIMPVATGKYQDGKAVVMPPKPLIVTGSRDSQLRVWRLPEVGSRRYIQTGPPATDDQCPYFIRILEGHTHSVRAISAHGDTLVSGSYDSTVRVWRISTGEQLHVMEGHTQKVYSVVLDHKRNRCISGSMDSLVKIWDLDTGACLHTLMGHTLLVGLLDLRDDRLVSAAADSTLRIWDPENGKCKSQLTAHTGAITCFQHDGRKVISGSEKTVKMWDINTGECIQDLLTDLGGVWQVKFDERRCVAAVQRGNLTYVEVSRSKRGSDGQWLTELLDSRFWGCP